MKAMYDERIRSLAEVMGNLENEQSHMDMALSSENILFKKFLKHGQIENLDRGILSELIDVVLVRENNEIVIRFRHADELAQLIELIEQDRMSQEQ